MGRGALLALISILAACALTKPPPPSPPRYTSLGLSIKQVTLANGLRVVLVHDPHASEVQVTMRYRVGAGDDLEYPGMAHFVEHLMFEQTLGAQSLIAHLEDNATFFNAFTSYDATTYISRARPEFLDKLLSIEAVRLGFRCTSITDSAFEREREVVKREIELRDYASELLVAVHGAIYPDGHPYRQPIGGSADSLGTITRDQACKFADAYYAPANAALVISGNVSNERAQAALGKFLARIPKRLGAAANAVPAAHKLPQRDVPAPIDDKAVLVTWPLPSDPYTQLTLKVIASATTAAIDRQIKGRIDYLALGDVRAPVIGYWIEPRDGETVDEVLATVRETLEALPRAFEGTSKRAFDTLRQHAIYAQYASLEDGSDRDQRLAAHVLAGRDPGEALAAEFRALRNLGDRDLTRIVLDHFTFEDASVATLAPSTSAKRGRSVAVQQATHDMGQRRSVPDVARAHEPDRSIAIPAAPTRTRTLPNGLKIVLMPLSTVPTVDVRLVFGAGSADDPADKRGSALVAAQALDFDMRHFNDILSFAIAGGKLDADVTRDRTSFVVRGVDMHLDYLLAGLRRWAIDGVYTTGADELVEILRRERKHVDEDAVISDAWNAALYGAQHPYAHAGVLHATAAALTVEDAERFRNTYFKPDNATLVIAGRFDVTLAERWIDYLFADWSGRAKARQVPPPAPTAASLAKLEELTQMLVRVALPAPAASRAHRLVAAAMLDDIARDVRHQLGAAYGFNAWLAETPLASTIVVGGWIDPARANEVVELLRDRLQQLRDDADAAARAFVVARGRVIANLASLTGSASLLAERAETDIGLGRPALSDLETAKDVQALTIEQLAPLLSQLDLSRAAVLMRGPADPVKGAFAVLGREPTLLHFDQAKEDTQDEPDAPAPASRSREGRIYFSHFEESLTDQSVRFRSPLEITLAVSLATGNAANLIPPTQIVPVDGSISGVSLLGEVGYRFAKRLSAGAAFGIGMLTGSYGKKSSGVVYDTVEYGFVPIDIAAFAHVRPLDRLWGGFLLGVHMDGARFDEEKTWTSSLGLGVEVGYDLVGVGPHWLALVARANASYLSDIGFGSLSAGLAYRH